MRQHALSGSMGTVDVLARRRRRMAVTGSWRQWGGGTVAVVAAVMTWLSLGYGYLAGRGAGPQPAARGASLSALCAGRTGYFPGNAPYAGPGPHPFAVFEQRSQADAGVASPVKFEGSTWLGTPFVVSDAAKVQLVACSERAREQKTGLVCILQKRRIPLYRALYRVRVRAAATGRLVGEAFLQPLDDTCAAYPLVDLRRPRVFSLPSAADYARALRQFSSQPAQDSGVRGDDV